MENNIRDFLNKAVEQQDGEALQSAYNLIKDLTSAYDSGQAPNTALELFVICAEIALRQQSLKICASCLKSYFDRNPPANYLLCRAYLCQGQIRSPLASGNVEDFEECVNFFLEAIGIAKSDPKYHFVVFNASVLYFKAVRTFLQPGSCHYLIPSFRIVVQSLEEVADPDYKWRAELMMHLIKCLVDSGKTKAATDFAKVTEKFIKSHVPDLYSNLFVLLVQHSLEKVQVLTEMTMQDSTLAVIYKVEECKKMEEIKKGRFTQEVSDKLEEIFSHLVDSTQSGTTLGNDSKKPAPVHPTKRVTLLLELAMLSLQVKQQKVAANCLKELKLAKTVNTCQRIIMKCVKSEINLLKKDTKMNIFTKASVEARMQEIGKLDHWLRSAVTASDRQAVQAVCATQWKVCLPLLQHGLKKHIKATLLRMVHELEDIQSLMLEMRCQIHMELAVIEEEDGFLESSLTHLQKAIQLDNGRQDERLSSALHLLQLRKTPYQTLSRNEDKAAMLLQQARDKHNEKKNIRPILVAVGVLLASEDFQTLLNADNISKIPVGTLGSAPMALLFAKAKHYTECLQKVSENLTSQADDTDNTGRMNLWVTLVKTARRNEVWDVCRAACRFCLPYDNEQWKISKAAKCGCSEDESCAECVNGCLRVRDYMLHLAEVYLICAEATVQKLFTEGFQLNSPPVLPQDAGLQVSIEGPQWITFRDWIQGLSSYATSNFLRAAELGLEIMEPWVVINSAIYLWNYNSHLIMAGDYQTELSSFQNLLDMLRKVECSKNRILVVLLCNVVARGLTEPLFGPDGSMPNVQAEKGRRAAVRGKKKNTASVNEFYLDAAGMKDANCALELCDYALHVSNSKGPGEVVPISVKKQVVTTWVQIKMMLQQQICSNINVKDDGKHEEISELNVLVEMEKLQCNKKSRHMDFKAHSLSTLVKSVSECRWTDVVVKLQVWCQLAALGHSEEDQSLVMCCTGNALQLEETAATHVSSVPCVLYDMSAVNAMLSNAACLRGMSLVQKSKGDLPTFREALKVIFSSVRYAEKAKNPTLCITAARHYWNTCLPLTHRREERQKLQDPLEKILNALVQTSTKQTQVRMNPSVPQLDISKQEISGGEDLTLKAAIYSLVLRIHIDKTDKSSTLLLLDKAISNLPSTKHTIRLLKHCILLKARMGQSVLMDMQKLREEELACSLMWRRVALFASTPTQQLTSYQRAITSLVSPETEWQKVNFVLEFAQWLYYNNFPRVHAQHHIGWAIDILLQPKQEEEAKAEETEDPKSRRLNSMVRQPLIGVRSLCLRTDLSTLKEVYCLDYLVQAHTLLAFMADRSSPEHQLHLLSAFTFVIQIWLVSMAEVSDMLKPPPTAGSKKGKQKTKVQKKGKTAEDRLDQALPSSPEEWARYICPSQARIIFRANKNQHCINTYTITNQMQSIFYLTLLGNQLDSISLNHLTLPVLHLAEIIANDLLNKKSLSDLFRIKIFQTCCQLGLEKYSPYQKRLLDLLTNNEQEQIKSHKVVALSKEKGMNQKASNQTEELDENTGCGKQRRGMCFQNIYLEKAEVCLSMELFQPARQLLVEAHLMAKDLGDQKALAKCLLGLATLACKEQNHAQALILLDQAQALGGDEEFWYHFTLTKVNAVLGERHKDVQTKVQKIINQGCEALKTVQEKQLNRVKEVKYLITRLEMRSVMESITALNDGESGINSCYENVQKLMAASERLEKCASSFTELGYTEKAAEAHAEYAQCMKTLATKTADKEEKQHLLLHGLSQMQLAVIMQEQLVLNAQKLLPPKDETCGISLETAWRLLYLRLGLVELCLVLMEDHCAEATVRALAREKMSPVEIALEDFTASSPEPDSMEHKWIHVGKTLGQVALGQLATINFHPLHDIETQARCLNLMGKYLRLQALLKDPIHVYAIWRQTKPTEVSSDSETVSAASEPSEKDKESSQTESVKPITECPEVKKRRRKANQILSQAAMAISETINLCLEHNLSSFILAEATVNMLGCVGQPDSEAAGQYLALFQSCCAVTTIAKALCSTCIDTRGSQLAALLSLHSKMLNSRVVTCGMLKGLKDSLKKLSNACSHLIVNPNHFNLLSDLPSNLKILLLQHSENHSELYGAFYEMAKSTENKKAKTTKAGNTISCSKVAKVFVCPQHLVALREQMKAFSHEARHTLFKEVCLHSTEEKHEASEELQTSTVDEKLAPLYCKIVQDLEDYLYPLLSQMDLPCFRPQTSSEPNLELTQSKDKKEKQSSTKLRKPEFVVVLADSTLLDLPLESLLIFQQGNFSSVSRDFSLQLLHSRLRSAKAEKVPRDKKEGKGGKGGGNKKLEINKTIPSYAIPVETRNLKYIVDTGSGLSAKIVEILDDYGKLSKQKCEGYMSGQQTPSLSDIEELLSKCSAFIYIGREQLMANVPPAKLVLGRLSRCQMALLFEQVYGNVGTFRQAMEDMDTSKEQSPVETALLLSLSGVGCVILNQWQSSLQDNTDNMTTVVQNLLKGDRTSGQIIHELRKRNTLVIPKTKDTESNKSECLSKEEDEHIKIAFSLSDINCIVYGLPNLILV